jgi:hypothetical protein
MTGDRRPKGVDVDRPTGWIKRKLRRWRRRKDLMVAHFVARDAEQSNVSR